MFHTRAPGPALTDTISGQTDLFCSSTATALPHVKAGRLRGLAVTTANRLPAEPDVPTLAEAGVKGYDVPIWHGLIAPKGVPQAAVARVNEEVNRMLQGEGDRRAAAERRRLARRRQPRAVPRAHPQGSRALAQGSRRHRRQGPISKTYDVIVVGAGAAGLAAADALAHAGRSVLVLEARSRIGGRCWTRRLPGLPVPIELGAEFIHGQAESTLALLARAGVPGVDSTRTQRFVRGRRLVEGNAFIEAQKAVKHASILRKEDLSFAQFLQRKSLPAVTRTLATMMVQGFDAADPARVSAREIAEEWGSGALGSSQMRPQGGYLPLLEHLLNQKFKIRLKSPVREIHWKRGEVEVDGIRARKAILTLPLGVLQARSVKFYPDLNVKRAALSRLASGPVIRVAMRFREDFWQERCAGVAFFHNPAAAFPTFWTPLPMHAPLLTAWAGGPKAAALSGSSRQELIRQAIASVRSALGRVPPLQAALVQDWQADPYSRGGYSYVLVGGQGAREALRKPLEKTLYFAGEATDTDEAGTVAGALRSGLRAAREVMRS